MSKFGIFDKLILMHTSLSRSEHPLREFLKQRLAPEYHPLLEEDGVKLMGAISQILNQQLAHDGSHYLTRSCQHLARGNEVIRSVLGKIIDFLLDLEEEEFNQRKIDLLRASFLITAGNSAHECDLSVSDIFKKIVSSHLETCYGLQEMLRHVEMEREALSLLTSLTVALNTRRVNLVNLARQWYKQGLLLDHIAGLEGLRAQRYRDSLAEVEGNLRFHFLTLPNEAEWLSEDPSLEARFLRISQLEEGKWEYFEKFIFATINKKGCDGREVVEEISHVNNSAHVGLIGPYPLGDWNFYRILTHFTRNCAKHGYNRGKHRNLDIVVEFGVPPDLGQHWRGQGYSIRLYSNVNKWNKETAKLCDRMNEILKRPFVDPEGRLMTGIGRGVMEFRIHGTFLCLFGLNIPGVRIEKHDLVRFYPHIALLGLGEPVPVRYEKSPIGTLALRIGLPGSVPIGNREVGIVLPA